MNSCSMEEFLCSTGECIPMGRRCNIEKDCSDESDEQNCNIVTGSARAIIGKFLQRQGVGSLGEEIILGSPSVEVVVEATVFQILRLNKNIARGSTDPGYWLFNSSYLSSLTKCHLHWFQIWPIVCGST